MERKKLPKSYGWSLGIFPFVFGGQIIYSVLSDLLYYGAKPEQGINFFVYTFAGFALFTSGLWMIAQKTKLNLNLGLKGLILAILSFSFGAMLLLEPVYAIISGNPNPSNGITQYPATSFLSNGLWGFSFIGIAIWLYAHSGKPETKQNPS